jgi:hypothetical protein
VGVVTSKELVVQAACAFLVVSGLISGCASDSSTAETGPLTEFNSDPGQDTRSDPNSAIPNEDTQGQLIPIQSDNVAYAGYDLQSQTMFVEFDNGALYAYAPVPGWLWRDFLAAQPHPWSSVGHPLLVEGRIPYRRLQ